MKIVLEFNLPDDKFLSEAAIQGPEWIFAMDDLDRWLRTQLKHGDVGEDYQVIRDKLQECLKERGLNLDVIY